MKFFIDNIYLLCIVVASAVALALPTLQRRGKKVTPLQATLLINKNQATILDVRDAEFFNIGHLRGAKHIPVDELAKRVDEVAKDKDAPVIVVCESGNLSARGAAVLLKAGFTNAFSLNGGMTAWNAAQLPITKE